jgi:uncharacterized protein (TIGR02266 family)
MAAAWTMDSSDSHSDPPSLDRERVPLERKISLKFKEFRGFITEYSANISMGGMFITTDTPQPPGSVFDFEFSLAEDDFQIIHGLGEVMWVRSVDAGPDLPAGMGIRFLHLGEGSQDLIRRMVDEHVRSGGTPFDLEEQAPGAGASPGEEEVPRRSLSSADELAETTALDLDPELEPTTSLRLTGAVPEPVEEAPPPDSYQRFDAAMASLRHERRGETRDLPPGFDEVAAALRSTGQGATEVSEPEIPDAEPSPPPPEPLSRREPFRPTEPPPPSAADRPIPPPDVPVYDAHYGAPPRETGRFRWVLLVLVVLAAAAGAAHFFLPGGLPGLLSDQESAAAIEPAEEAPVERTLEPPLAPGPPSPTEEPSMTEAEPGYEPRPAPSETADALPRPRSVAAAAFERLTEIDFRREPGRTVITLSLDGGIEEGRYAHFRLGGEHPREVVRLVGVSDAYSPTELPVGSPEVERIRVGYHAKPGGNELHLVMDLGAAEVELTSLEPAGNRLVLTLE